MDILSTHVYSNERSQLLDIWRFPRMGHPQLSSILIGFSIINHPIVWILPGENHIPSTGRLRWRRKKEMQKSIRSRHGDDFFFFFSEKHGIFMGYGAIHGIFWWKTRELNVAGKARTKLEVLRGTSALNDGIVHFRVWLPEGMSLSIGTVDWWHIIILWPSHAHSLLLMGISLPVIRIFRGICIGNMLPDRQFH